MPKIDVSDPTFEWLKSLAEPFVDTPETVIIRGLEALEENGKPKVQATASGPVLFDAAKPPNLAFGTIQSITLCGSDFMPNQWNALLLAVIEKAMQRLDDRRKVKELIVVNCVSGEKTVTGYKYVPSADVSVQGQDSNKAWKAISHIARRLGIPIEVVFTWNDNPKAASPGMTGRFLIEGD